MINIFGDGPYLVSVEELAFQAAGELIWYVLHVSPFALAAFLLKRRLRGTAEWTAAWLSPSYRQLSCGFPAFAPNGFSPSAWPPC